MPTMDLPGELSDRVDALSSVLSSQPNPVGRDLGLEIERENNGLILRIYPSERLKAKFPQQKVALKLTEAQLFKEVLDCQAVWWEQIVERHTIIPRFDRGYYHFHAKAENPISEEEYRQKVLPKLAEAGEQLFVQVFHPSGADFEETRTVGDALRELMQQPDLWITIRSRHFIVPWNFMYLGDAAVPCPAGFWGCQHLIEHDVAKRSPNTAPFAPILRIAAHFDVNIDVDDESRRFRCIQGFRDLLGGYGLLPRERNTRGEFSSALRKCPDEHVFYFCCHARAGKHTELSFEGQRLFLTDSRPQKEKEFIEPSQIDAWLDKCQELPGRPLVFINACEAVKSGSSFYEGFAAKFLDHSASAVVGPELEIPVIFAREFAHHFFEDFFRGGQENSVGKIVLRWRRKYSMEFQNPLGLAYSLYRGGDVLLEAPLALFRRSTGPPSSGE